MFKILFSDFRFSVAKLQHFLLYLLFFSTKLLFKSSKMLFYSNICLLKLGGTYL